MSIRQFLFAASLVAAAAPAFASEAGYIEPAPQFGVAVGEQAAKTLADRRAYQHGDLSADGRYVYVGGDRGWAQRPHDMRIVEGKLVHGDTCVHNAPKPSLSLNDAEKQLFNEIQIGG